MYQLRNDTLSNTLQIRVQNSVHGLCLHNTLEHVLDPPINTLPRSLRQQLRLHFMTHFRLALGIQDLLRTLRDLRKAISQPPLFNDSDSMGNDIEP